MDAVTLFHHIQHAQRVHCHHLDAAIGLLVKGRGQVGGDGGHIQLTLDELGHDLVRRTIELQVVVLAGLAAALHIQQIDQAHGGGTLQARNAHASFCFGGKSPASQQADHQRSRQQQGGQFFHHGSDSFLSLLFQPETKFANFAKSFALRAQVYYNGAKNTVAHATELQKGGEGPGKTSRN